MERILHPGSLGISQAKPSSQAPSEQTNATPRNRGTATNKHPEEGGKKSIVTSPKHKNVAIMDHARPSPHAQRVGHPTGYGPPTGARRGPGPMLGNAASHHHPNISQAQLHQQHQQAMQDRELAKRRARKPTDKTIPEGVDEIVPNVELYKRLRDMERRYDATILRKRLDVQDAVNRNVKVRHFF